MLCLERKSVQRGDQRWWFEEHFEWIGINTLEYPFALRFISNQILWRFGTRFTPKKVFHGWTFRKHLSNSESVLLNTPLYWVLFSSKHFNILRPNLPRKSILGREFKKKIWAKTKQPWIPLCTEFYFKQNSLKFQDQICPKKILEKKFNRIIIEFKIGCLEYPFDYLFVSSFI